MGFANRPSNHYRHRSGELEKMGFNEWQAGVLIELWSLHDEHVLSKGNVLTIPEIVDVLLERKRFGGESTVRKFLYDLKEHGVLLRDGKQVRNYRVHDGYCFVPKNAYNYVKDNFEDSVLFKLVYERVYSYIQHRGWL